MQISNTFSNGTIADADDVNENFDDVVGPLNTGWTPSNTNPTCATNNVLTLNNADEFIAVGEKMEITVSSVIYYGYAIAVSGSSITGIWATNAGVAYTLTAGSLITSFRYSKGNAVGFPDWFAWSPTIGASESMTFNGTASIAEFRIVGRKVEAYFASTAGTTGGTASYGITVTPPISGLTNLEGASIYSNGGATTVGTVSWVTANLAYFRTTNGANWALSGSTRVAGWINSII